MFVKFCFECKRKLFKSLILGWRKVIVLGKKQLKFLL